MIAIIAACSSPTSVDDGPAVRITTARVTYAPGESVHVAIENLGPGALGYFPCPIVLDRVTATGWRAKGTIPGFGPDDCDLVFTPLAPGETARLTVSLNRVEEEGTYRFRLDGLRAAEAPLQRRVTNPFAVIR